MLTREQINNHRVKMNTVVSHKDKPVVVKFPVPVANTVITMAPVKIIRSKNPPETVYPTKRGGWWQRKAPNTYGRDLKGNSEVQVTPPPMKADEFVRCRKCNATSGDNWSQCNKQCPMPTSPWYDPELNQRG